MNRLSSLFSFFPATVRRRSPLAMLLALDAAHRQRRALLRMDSAQLTDIGLKRRDAETEAARPVWNVPHHWMR